MKKILLVDDEKDLCFLLSAFLEDEHTEVRMSHSIRDAEKLLREGFSPDILFLDLNLPDGFGPDLIQMDIPSIEDSRVFFITAFSDQLGPKETWDKRVEAVIDKPFTLAEIQRLLN